MIENAYQELMQKAATDVEFRGKLLTDPRSTIESLLGVPLPEGLKLRIVENTPSEVTLVIPPSVSSELSDDQLEAVAGGKSLGTTADVGLSVISFGVACAVSAAMEGSVSNCRKVLNPDITG